MRHRNTTSALCHWNIFPLIAFSFGSKKLRQDHRKYDATIWPLGKLNFKFILIYPHADIYLCTVKQIHTKQYFLVRLAIVQILSYIRLTSSPVPETQQIYFKVYLEVVWPSINFPSNNLFQRLQEVKAHQHRIWKQTLHVHAQHEVLLRRDQ